MLSYGSKDTKNRLIPAYFLYLKKSAKTVCNLSLTGFLDSCKILSQMSKK